MLGVMAAPFKWVLFADLAIYYGFFLQLTEVAGVGCIVRVMTDRKTL